jgi:hypothetical protein
MRPLSMPTCGYLGRRPVIGLKEPEFPRFMVVLSLGVTLPVGDSESRVEAEYLSRAVSSAGK